MEHALTVAVAVASAHGNSDGEQVNFIIIGEKPCETSRCDHRDWEANSGRIALSSSACGLGGLGGRWVGNGDDNGVDGIAIGD